MSYLIKGLIFVCVWLGCVLVGYLIPYVTDPRHDVEFAVAASIGMALGVLLGPILGYLTVMLVFQDN